MADGAPPPKRQKTEGEVFSLENQLPDELVPSSDFSNVTMNNGANSQINQTPLTQSQVPGTAARAITPIQSHNAMVMPHPPVKQHKLSKLLQSGHNSPKYVGIPSPNNSNAINSPRPPRQPSQPQPSPLSAMHNSHQSPSAGSMGNNMRSPTSSTPGSLPRPSSRPSSTLNATPSPRPGSLPSGLMSAGSANSAMNSLPQSSVPYSTHSPMMMNQQINQQNMVGQTMSVHMQQNMQQKHNLMNGPSRSVQVMPQQQQQQQQQGMMNTNITRPGMPNNGNNVMRMMNQQQQQTIHMMSGQYTNSVPQHMPHQGVGMQNQMQNTMTNFGPPQTNVPTGPMQVNMQRHTMNSNASGVFNNNMPMSRPQQQQSLMSPVGGGMQQNQVASGINMSGMTGNNINFQMIQQQQQQPSSKPMTIAGSVLGMDKVNNNMQFNNTIRPRMSSIQPSNNMQQQTMNQQQQINHLASQLDPQLNQSTSINLTPMQQLSNQTQMPQHQTMPQIVQSNPMQQTTVGNGGAGTPQTLNQMAGGATQPGTSNSNTPADPEKRRLIQQQLVLLLHAYKCAKKEHNGEAPNCTLPHCRTMKEVLRHMNVCTQGKSCQVAHCASSRQIISHWRACNRHDCVVCLPLKSVPNNNPAAVPSQAQRWTPYNSTASTVASSTSASTSATAVPYVNQEQMLSGNLQQQNHQQFSNILSNGIMPGPTPGMQQIGGVSQSSEPSSNLFHPARVEREWHVDVTEELRNHLVQKLVQAIFPTPQKISLTDDRMKKLVTFARKVEGDMYEQASSRSEYYHLLAEKIYKIQKELEEKRASRMRTRIPPGQVDPTRMPMNGPMDAAGQNQGVNAMHRNMGMDSFLQQGTGRMPGPSMPTVNTNSILGMDNMSNPSLATQGSVFDSMLNATQSQVPTQQTMTIGNQARTMVDPVDHSETLLKFMKAKDEISQAKQNMPIINQGPGISQQIAQNSMTGMNNSIMPNQGIPGGIANFQQQAGQTVSSGAGRPPSVSQVNQLQQQQSSPAFQASSMLQSQMQQSKPVSAQPRLESLLKSGIMSPHSNTVCSMSNSASMSNNFSSGNDVMKNTSLLQQQLRQNHSNPHQQQFTSPQQHPASLQEMLQGGISSSITTSTTTTTMASTTGLPTSMTSTATPTTVTSSSPSPFVSKPQVMAKNINEDGKLSGGSGPFHVSSNSKGNNFSNVQVKTETIEHVRGSKPDSQASRSNLSSVKSEPWSPSRGTQGPGGKNGSNSTTIGKEEPADKMDTSTSPNISAVTSATTTTTISPFVKQESSTGTMPTTTSSMPVSKTKSLKKVFTCDEMRNALMPVVEKLYQQEPEAIPFRQPVDPDKLNIPDYFDIVKQPTDLASIMKNLQIGKYQEPWEFIGEMWLMFHNAWLYNRRTTRIYKYCSKLKEMFEAEIDPVMQSLGFCCGRRMEFMPMTLCCYGKQLCTIPTGATYFEYQNRYDYCEKCFNEIPGDSISLADDPSQPQSAVTTIMKSQFEKKKNDVLDPEPFITCNECGRKMHKICVLYTSSIWKEGFNCDKCNSMRNTQRKPNRYIAAKLPQNILGEHIERRVNNYIKQYDTNGEAGQVHIRVVYSGDKTVEVRPGMKARFVDTKEMPESFPYRAKAFFAFEEIDGVDVCFFGVHVQEYGSDAPHPNQRRVYLSYLDSVHFFRPRHLRTAIYHEILIGYFEYCKNLGYEFAHIWACPPCEGDDYIFHCHPLEQKIPKPKRLQDWYKKMLDKAISEQIIIDYKDIFHQAKEDRLQSARELPYFEGDFWPNVLEESIKELEQEEEDRKRAEANEQAAAEESDHGSSCSSKNGKNKKSKKASSKKASQRITKKKIPQVANDLSDKLYQTMEKHKEVFFVIRLQTTESINKIGPTSDPDPTMQCDLMDGRDAFLTMAREKHYEFSSLRRAKWSTMAMLVELHTQGQDKFVYMCNNCRHSVDTRFHCTVCEDYDLCANCYHNIGHEHKMDQMGFGLDDGGSPGSGLPNAKSSPIPVERCMQSLVHACQCRNANCSMPACVKMKKVVEHAKNCKKKTTGHCRICKQLIALCCYHAKHCQEKKCPVAFCLNIKNKLKQQEMQQKVQQAYLMRRRMALMSRNVNTSSSTAPSTPKQNQASPKPHMTPDHHMHKPQPSPLTTVNQDVSSQHAGMNQNTQHVVDNQGMLAGPQTPGNMMSPQIAGQQQSQQMVTAAHMTNNQQQGQYVMRNNQVQAGMIMNQAQGSMVGMSSPISVNSVQPGMMGPTQPSPVFRKYQSPPPQAAVLAAKQAQQLAEQQAKERERISKFMHNPGSNQNSLNRPTVPRSVVPGNTVGWPNQMQHRAPIRQMMPGQVSAMQPVNTMNNQQMTITSGAPPMNNNQALKQVINLLRQDNNQPGGSSAGRGRVKSTEQLMALLKTNPQLMSSIIKQRKQNQQNKQLSQQKQVMTQQPGLPVSSGNVQQVNMGGGMQQMTIQNVNQPVMNMQPMQGGMGNMQQMRWQQQQQQQRRMQQQPQGQFQQPAPPYPQAISQQRMMNIRMPQQHRMPTQIRHPTMNQNLQGSMTMQQTMMGQQVSSIQGGHQSPLQHHPGMMNPGVVTQVGNNIGGQPVPSSRPPSQPMPSPRVPQMSPHSMAGRTTPLGQGQVMNQGSVMPHMVQNMDQQFNSTVPQTNMMTGNFNRQMTAMNTGMNPHPGAMGFSNAVGQDMCPPNNVLTGQDGLEHFVKNEQ